MARSAGGAVVVTPPCYTIDQETMRSMDYAIHFAERGALPLRGAH